MQHPERSRRRRRDNGLNQVTVWTRRAVGVGVVLSGTLAAGLAHLLPGQAADRPPSASAGQTGSGQPADQATPPTTPGTPAPSQSASAARPHRAHHHHLSPPTTPPAAPPSIPQPAHTTSGGS